MHTQPRIQLLIVVHTDIFNKTFRYPHIQTHGEKTHIHKYKHIGTHWHIDPWKIVLTFWFHSGCYIPFVLCALLFLFIGFWPSLLRFCHTWLGRYLLRGFISREKKDWADILHSNFLFPSLSLFQCKVVDSREMAQWARAHVFM